MVLWPVQRANAFVAPLAVPYVVTSTGQVIAWTAAAVSALVASGVAIWAVKFKDSGGNDALIVHTNSKSPKPTPSGWTPGAAGAAPVPPGTAAQQQNVTGCTSNLGGNQSGAFGPAPGGSIACVQAIDAALGAFSFTGITLDPGDQWHANVPETGGTAFGSIATVTACPTGYTVSGGSCTLTNASVVEYPSDGVGQKSSVGGSFSDDTRDPDNAAPSNVTTTAPQVTVKEGSTTTKIKIEADGSVTISTSIPNGNGTTSTTTLKTSAPNAGASDGGVNAIGLSTALTQGEGESNTEAAGDACGGVPCATEGTQAQNRALLEQIKTNTDGSSVTEAQKDLTSQKAALDSSVGTHNDALTSATQVSSLGLGLSIAWPVGSCSNPTFAIPHGHGDLTVDMCGRRADLQAALQWFMTIATALALFGIGISAVRKD
jgi:hypothetical protein